VSTVVLVLQGLLALFVVVLCARWIWRMVIAAPLDAELLAQAVEAALSAGEMGLGRRLVEACLPAWPAAFALPAITALEHGEPVAPALGETEIALEHALGRGQDTMRALARMASPLALMAIILELGRAGTDRGLHALQRGLPLRLALDHSLVAFALGLGTTLVALTALGIARRSAHSIRHAHAKLTRIISEHAASAPRFTSPRAAL